MFTVSLEVSRVRPRQVTQQYAQLQTDADSWCLCLHVDVISCHVVSCAACILGVMCRMPRVYFVNVCISLGHLFVTVDRGGTPFDRPGSCPEPGAKSRAANFGGVHFWPFEARVSTKRGTCCFIIGFQCGVATLVFAVPFNEWMQPYRFGYIPFAVLRSPYLALNFQFSGNGSIRVARSTLLTFLNQPYPYGLGNRDIGQLVQAAPVL